MKSRLDLYPDLEAAIHSLHSYQVPEILAIPDGVVLCDVCGNPIFTPMIMLLVLDGYLWGIICEECRRKYHYDKQLLLWSEYEEKMVRIGEGP